MNSLFRKLRKKWNNKGESMAEVLIAALIIELALIAAASMIISAGSIIKKSKIRYDAYYATKNAIARDEGLVNDGNTTVSIKKNGTNVLSVNVGVEKTDSSNPIYIFEKAGS